MRGIDILTISDEQIVSLGITSKLHIGRVKTSKAQLMKRQESLDAEVRNPTLQNKQYYAEMEVKYKELMRTNPDYILPPKMNKWQPIDVYVFIRLPENCDRLRMFKKPLAMSKVDGKKLIEMTRDNSTDVRLSTFTCIDDF